MRGDRIPVYDRVYAADTGDEDEWWGAFEREVLECLAREGALSAAEIGRQLGVSEAAATSLVSMLAGQGKVRLGLVELASPARGSTPGTLSRAA